MRLFSLVLMMGVIALTIYRVGPWRQPDLQAIGAVADQPADESARQPAPQNAATRAAEHSPHNIANDRIDPSTDDKPTIDDSAANDVKPNDASAKAADEQVPREPPQLQDTDSVAADDRNDEERSAFRWESQGMADQSTLVQGFELPAYRRLFKWITPQSTEELAARNPPAAVFQQLTQHSERYRGELLTLELTVRRVEEDPVVAGNPAGLDHVYQLWGWPTSGRGWLYVIVTPELPPGFPIGPDAYQTVRVYGYFFKLQGYQPANAKPNARPLVAPLIVGKLVWEPTTATVSPAEKTLSLVFLAGGSLIVLCAIGYWIVKARRKKRQVSPQPTEVDWPDERRADSPAEYEGDDNPEEPARDQRDNFDWLRE
jgi:hypothetical protein